MGRQFKDWTGMAFASSARAAEDRIRWKGIVVKSSMVPQRPPKVMGWTRLDLKTPKTNNIKINYLIVNRVRNVCLRLYRYVLQFNHFYQQAKLLSISYFTPLKSSSSDILSKLRHFVRFSFRTLL